MHPEITSDTPGKCPICGGMDLVLENEVSNSHQSSDQQSYRPLLIIIGLIALATLTLSINDARMGHFSFSEAMRYFMAGFFLVFAGFKLLDLKGFAEGYATYDLLAKRVHGYGYVYPFIELGLGLAYLVHLAPFWINIIALIIMTFSGVGVALKLKRGEKFQCACLGTFLKVPLTKVTLIEDFGMALMALAMLLSF